MIWVDLEDPLKDVVETVRERKNGLEEISVPHECPERRVFHCSSLPWISTTGQVDQDNTK